MKSLKVGSVCVIALIALMNPSRASAQVVAPSASNDLTVGPGTSSSNVTPTGLTSASVPLQLPTPRGNVPLPLSINYTGSTHMGAAGSGWEIPLSFVRRSASTWHRKPSLASTAEDFVPERMILSLGGATMVMLPSSTPDTYVPFLGEEFVLLRRNRFGWQLENGAGLRYTFSPSSALGLGDENLWLLTEVMDTVSGDSVLLDYDIEDRGCGTEVDLAALRYTFRDDDPLYTVKILYQERWVDADPHDAALVCRKSPTSDAWLIKLGVTDVDDPTVAMTVAGSREQPRTRYVDRVVVEARNNLEPAVGAKIIQEYRLDYDDDPDTGLPRLASVDLHGEGGGDSPSLPLARYGYSALTTAGDNDVHYGPLEMLPRDDDAFAAGATSIAGSVTTTEYFNDGLPGEHPPNTVRMDRVRSRYALRDFTGDNVPDLVFKSGDTWHLQQGVVTGSGPSLSDGPSTTWTQPSEIFVQETRRFTNPEAPPGAMVTTEILTEYLDWNGDGRLDIVDAAGGSDLEHWRVWLNQPDDVTILRFEPVEIDIGVFVQRLRDDGILLDYLGTGQPTRLPIERSRSSPRFLAYHCWQYLDLSQPGPGVWRPCKDKEPGDPPPGTLEVEPEERSSLSDSVVEWKVQDLNGDGYPDLVGSRKRVRECRQIDRDLNPDAHHVQHQFEVGGEEITADVVRVRTWVTGDDECSSAHDEEFSGGYFDDGFVDDDLARPVQFSVLLNRAGALATAWSPDQQPQLLDGRGPLAHWTTAGTGDEPTDPAVSTQRIGFRDPGGLGIVRHVAVGVPGDTFVLTEGCDARSISTQRDGLVDLNGDGLPDHVVSRTVRFGTSAGFTAAHGIADDGIGFVISQTEDCASSTTTRGLVDLDGDGRPEFVKTIAGQLWFSRQVDAAGLPLGGEVGRLISIDNGHGAVTRFSYANNKAAPTSHQVPAPEIVVSETHIDVEDGSASDTDRVRYAYGTPEMRYDPMFDRLSFAGYRRTVSMVRGLRAGGVATIVDRFPQSMPGGGFVALARAGRLRRISRLEGVSADDSTELLGATTIINPLTDPFLDARIRGQRDAVYGVTALHLAPFSASVHGDCYDVDFEQPGIPVELATCWHSGVVHQSASLSWVGRRAPPSSDNVVSGSTVDEVDERGRVTQTRDFGDLRVPGDDTCTTIDYATAPVVTALSAVAGVHVDDCGEATRNHPEPIVLAGTRYAYDDLPEGEVTRGQLTSEIVENYDVSDGSLLGEHVAMELEYDALGQVNSVKSTRALGSPATRLTLLAHDEFGLTATTSTMSATDVSAGPFVQTWNTSTWPSGLHDATGINGERTLTTLDVFGRTRRVQVEPAGEAPHTTLLQDFSDGDFDRTITSTTFPADVALPHVEHVHLDALGRQRFRQVELGADYGDGSLVTDLVDYDSLGRVIYQAAPFEWPGKFSPDDDLPLDPAEWPYGVNRVFDQTGRLVRVVETKGQRREPTASSVAGDTYVTTFGYDWAGGQAIATSAGPRDNDPTSNVSGAFSRSTLTALGRPISDARFDAAGNRLDLVEHAFDRLGAERLVRRYRVPATASGPVEWITRHDSAGRVISMQEPAAGLVTSHYDEWGELLETAWIDGGNRRIQRHRYDGLGRSISLVLATADSSGVETIESSETYLFDEHSGSPLQPDGDFLGRLSEIKNDQVGDTYFGYDALGRITRETYFFPAHGQPMTTSRTYSPGGALTDLMFETPAGLDHIRYDLDSAARTVQVTDLKSGRLLFDAATIDGKGRYRNVLLGNGAREITDYAADGREELVHHGLQTASGVRNHNLTGRDADGRLLLEVWTGVSQPTATYSYDAMGRLTRSVQGGADEQFAFNGLGNITEKRIVGSTKSRSYFYDQVDLDRQCWAVKLGTSPPTNGPACGNRFDGAGNLVSEGWPTETRSMSYDAGSRVTSVKSGSWRASFLYGPGGALAATSVTNLAQFQRGTWNFGDLMEERSVRVPGEPRPRKRIDRRVPGPQGLIATLRTENGVNETVYVNGDSRANRYFTRADGALAQSVRYRAFGEVTQDTGIQTAVTYSDDLWNGGDDLREVGVDLLGARLYDPVAGRFLQRDPISVTGSSTRGSPYAASFNDPINYADPSGMFPFMAIFGVYNPMSGNFSVYSWQGSGEAAALALLVSEVASLYDDAAAARAAFDTSGPNISGFDVARLLWKPVPGSSQVISFAEDASNNGIGNAGWNYASNAATSAYDATVEPVIDAPRQGWATIDTVRKADDWSDVGRAWLHYNAGQADLAMIWMSAESAGEAGAGLRAFASRGRAVWQGWRSRGTVRSLSEAELSTVLGGSRGSRILGLNLEKSGVVRPAESAAHHIVAEGAPEAAPAREVLGRYGIDINDAANGVFLPGYQTSANPAGAAVHGGLHTEPYYRTVNRRLGGATTREEVLDALDAIRNELLSGGLL